MKRPAITFLFVSLILLPLATTGASAHGPDPVFSGGLFAQNQRLEFRWRSGAEPSSAVKAAIREAASDANATRNAKAASFAYASDGNNPIGYGSGATCGVNGLACFTRSAPTGFTMWFREQGHVFDWGTLRWCQAYSTSPSGCYDAETVALDEFGHVEGLAHHDNYDDGRDYQDAVVQTVSRAKARDGWNMHVLGRCDVATLQREYDVPDSSARYSTCLDIDTVLTIASSDDSIDYGAPVTLSAVLKVADKDSYDRLGGNLVSGRAVKLQRRSPGTTAWTTVATMSAGASAGTYRHTVWLVTATEFRTSFATPSGEGLNGDSSATLRVAVGGCRSSQCLVPGPR